MSENIIINMAQVNNAKNFLSDILVDAENAGNLESTVDGLIMLFEEFRRQENLQSFIEELQIHLYDQTIEHDNSYLSYIQSIKAGKNYSIQNPS